MKQIDELIERRRVRMDGERQRYTVMARNERYVIMAKPFNAQKTYLYSIADLERGVRGPCDLIFGPPAALDADEGAAIALGMLAAGEMSVSYRRCKPLSDSEATLLRATEPSSGGTA